MNLSGQIIATSHDLTPNGGLVREITLYHGNLGWWNIIPIRPDDMMTWIFWIFWNFSSTKQILWMPIIEMIRETFQMVLGISWLEMGI